MGLYIRLIIVYNIMMIGSGGRNVMIIDVKFRVRIVVDMVM